MESSEIKAKIEEFFKKFAEVAEMENGFDLDFVEDEEAATLQANLKSDYDNLLIGYHGQTLNSFQHILNIILLKGDETETRVLLDIGGYREERNNKLREIAHSAAEKARFLQKSVALYPMNSYERKVVHEEIGTIDGVVSESEGEGIARRVIISPEDESATDTGNTDNTDTSAVSRE